jgi:hypothetical protein
MYQTLGFEPLNGGLSCGTKGYNPTSLGELIMVKTCGGAGQRARAPAGSTEAPHRALFERSAEPLRAEPFARRHWAAAVLLLNAFPARESEKLRGSGIGTGLRAELTLLRDVLASDLGNAPRFQALVRESDGRLEGLACGEERYLPPRRV